MADKKKVTYDYIEALLYSNDFALFDIEDALSIVPGELTETETRLYEYSIAVAYETYLNDVFEMYIPYGITISDYTATAEFVKDKCNVQIPVQIPVATIFGAHKDVFLKERYGFDQWLHQRSDDAFEESITEWFEDYHGEDFSRAMGAYLAYLIDMSKTSEQMNDFKNAFIENVENMMFSD